MNVWVYLVSLITQVPLAIFAHEWHFPMNYTQDEAQWRTAGKYDAQLVSYTSAIEPTTNKTICHQKFYRKHRKSQFSEDIWLYEHWFYGIKDGIVIESGAHQGAAMSNSYMFQSYANWKSIHIEGDPQNYEKLIQNRPEALNINAALCNESRNLHYVTGGQGSDGTRGFIEFMDPNFIKDWHGSTNVENLTTVIKCMPMKEILKRLQINHVDIWFLDVEGAEENVLQGTDFSTVKFNAIAMECDRYNKDKNHAKMHLLKKHHFRCLHLGMTCFCRNDHYSPSESPCGFSV